jgi:hypothetical protein
LKKQWHFSRSAEIRRCPREAAPLGEAWRFSDKRGASPGHPVHGPWSMVHGSWSMRRRPRHLSRICRHHQQWRASSIGGSCSLSPLGARCHHAPSARGCTVRRALGLTQRQHRDAERWRGLTERARSDHTSCPLMPHFRGHPALSIPLRAESPPSHPPILSAKVARSPNTPSKSPCSPRAFFILPAFRSLSAPWPSPLGQPSAERARSVSHRKSWKLCGPATCARSHGATERPAHRARSVRPSRFLQKIMLWVAGDRSPSRRSVALGCARPSPHPQTHPVTHDQGRPGEAPSLGGSAASPEKLHPPGEAPCSQTIGDGPRRFSREAPKRW